MNPEWFREPCFPDACPPQHNSSNTGDGSLSVIVVFDHPFDFARLDESLFSLAAQDWQKIEVVLTTPNAGSVVKRLLERMLRSQPWTSSAVSKIVSVNVKSQRTISPLLINAGLRHSTGRYVSILKSPDLVYQHSYPTLIDRLQSTTAAVAFGGTRVALHSRAAQHWPVISKQMLCRGKSRLGALLNMDLAIHSFVLDRTKLSAAELFVQDPGMRAALPLYLCRLALHSCGDSTLIDVPMFEVRESPAATDIGNTDKHGGGILASLAAAFSDDNFQPSTSVAFPEFLLAEMIQLVSKQQREKLRLRVAA